MADLRKASEDVENMAKDYGVQPNAGFLPAFDPEKIDINTGSLALHDGKVPVRLLGMGSKRLTTLAMQKAVTAEGTILLIDEIEHGLEPFRLRQLVRNLRDSTNREDGRNIGQVLFTTHSPVAVVECVAGEWHIVRRETGKTTVRQVSDSFVGTVRASAEALLSRKVIVCEEVTEVGLLRAFDRKWKETHNGAGMAYQGVSTIDGNGCTNAPQRAIDLKELGYEVLLFVDSDECIKPSRSNVESHDVTVVQWPDEMNTEQRIFRDMDDDTILRIVRLAIEITDDETGIMHALGSNLHIKGFNLANLQTLLADPEQADNARQALAKLAAKTFGWFKRMDYGERLGEIVANSIQEIPTTTAFSIGMKEIEEWIYRS